MLKSIVIINSDSQEPDIHYNKNGAGIDTVDQMIDTYNVGRNTIKGNSKEV